MDGRAAGPQDGDGPAQHGNRGGGAEGSGFAGLGQRQLTRGDAVVYVGDRPALQGECICARGIVQAGGLVAGPHRVQERKRGRAVAARVGRVPRRLGAKQQARLGADHGRLFKGHRNVDDAARAVRSVPVGRVDRPHGGRRGVDGHVGLVPQGSRRSRIGQGADHAGTARLQGGRMQSSIVGVAKIRRPVAWLHGVSVEQHVAARLVEKLGRPARYAHLKIGVVERATVDTKAAVRAGQVGQVQCHAVGPVKGDAYVDLFARSVRPVGHRKPHLLDAAKRVRRKGGNRGRRALSKVGRMRLLQRWRVPRHRPQGWPRLTPGAGRRRRDRPAVRLNLRQCDRQCDRNRHGKRKRC